MSAPAISRSAILFAHWSMRVGRDAPAYGAAVWAKVNAVRL
ncbi:hypothetical protein [Aureimonas leprariae]|nr:hypothetical protein [Aureimonas leprariae]